MASSLPLVIQNLSFRYHTRPEYALRGVSLELRPGEMLLVAGASGSGKSTLLRCINGLIPRSYRGDLEGSVLVHGEEAPSFSLAKLAQAVGTLLQDPEKQILGAHVKSEVAFGLENLGMPSSEIKARVTETLARLGLSDLRDRETFALSGGEKQKVALAGLLAMRPSILLLDEPVSSLDSASAHEALSLFRRLADEGHTIVLVEHRVESALTARPDRVLYLKDGQVHYLGHPDGLIDVVDWRQVKLPAPSVIQHIRKLEKPPVASPLEHSTVPPLEHLNARTLERSNVSPLVAFENVSFHYSDGPDVLKDINLEIRPGERVALLGPNGAGKSTLVKHAIGLVKPRRGRVLIEGRDTRELSVAQVAHTVGYCFQSPSHMLFAPTVTEELAFGPRNLGYSEAEIQQFGTEAVDLLKLTGLEKYSPLALSFGQQKRVTIACVVAMRSKLLALDEPTAGQDYGTYMSFMDSMLGTDDSNADTQHGVLGSAFEVILFITHDLDLAINYASRVILLADHGIAADGPPEVVLRDKTLLQRCRILPTSLLEENLRLLPHTKRFRRIETLADFVT